MNPDGATVIGYSACLFALISVMFLLFWGRNGRQAQYLWYGMPFVSGALSALMLINPSILPDMWGLRLGAFFAILAYGAGWQAARVVTNRKPLLMAAILPCLGWLAFSAGFDVSATGPLHTVSTMVRILIVAGFNGLAAREFWRDRSRQLPSGMMLFWVFAGYAALEFLKSPFSSLLPTPLGSAPPQLWSIMLFNLLVVTHALLASAFIIALLRERIAADHYRMALLDPLTGVGNRRALESWLAEHAGQRGSTLALLLFDIDRFKAINDNHGHGIGDVVIVRAAEAARRALLRSDTVFRIGGEEFACLIENTTRQEAIALAQRLRTTFERDVRQIGGITVSATISVGVATVDMAGLDGMALMAQADAALYEAKRTGRNRVVATLAPGQHIHAFPRANPLADR